MRIEPPLEGFQRHLEQCGDREYQRDIDHRIPSRFACLWIRAVIIPDAVVPFTLASVSSWVTVSGERLMFLRVFTISPQLSLPVHIDILFSIELPLLPFPSCLAGDQARRVNPSPVALVDH